MELKEVGKIVTTYQSKEANDYLDKGYILLAVAAGKSEEDYPITVYSLGEKRT